jgi:hypothetical protein
MAEKSMIRVSPWVTHERLDDEVIAINLETGGYFVLEGAAADCWSVLVDGASPDDVLRRLLGRYEVTEERARADSTSVLAELQDAGMLVVEEGETGSVETVPGAKVPYAEPSVQKYDDLEDLLLLDPIHEVDDAGWPVARPD